MKLIDAWNKEQNTSHTDNGCATNSSTLSSCLDFFSTAGSSRGKDISALFNKALSENKELACKALLWLRDVREGAGEREQFRILSKMLLSKDILKKTPELGRWDDVLVYVNTTLEEDAFSLVMDALKQGDGLCAKWMPRKGVVAEKLRAFLKMTPKQYRKTLVSLSDTVEQKMCAKQWSEINFPSVPSVAAARYQNAFNKNAKEEYEAYKAKLASGEAKVNASAIFPHDVIRALQNGDKDVAEAQWNSLPEYLEGSSERILSVVDVSGSMCAPVPNTKVNCIYIAIALGLYTSQRGVGEFKDVMMTFSESPSLFKASGSLLDRYNTVRNSDWGYNTNISAVFYSLLSSATHCKVPSEHMPTTLLIVSDMEFDEAVIDGSSVSAFEYMKEVYKKAGYDLPKIVFWNVNARVGNSPVTKDDNGTAVISGFSPSILKSVLSCKDIDPEEFSPYTVMINTLTNPRYSF